MQVGAPLAPPEPIDPNYPRASITKAIYRELLTGRGAAYVQRILDVHGQRYINWNDLDGGRTVLLLFCARNLADRVRSCILLGADPDIADTDGRDALNVAVINQAYDVVRYLLRDRRINPVRHTPKSLTRGVQTFHASPSGHVQTEFGPDTITSLPVICGTAISTILNMRKHPTLVRDRRDVICCELLMACNSVDSDSSTFSYGGSSVSLLLRDTRIRNQTLLFLLVRMGYHNTVNWLLKSFPGATDVNRGTDWHGNTPAHYVLNFFPESTCAYMLMAGANMNTSSVRRNLAEPVDPNKERVFNIDSASITPAEILRVQPGHPRYPLYLNVQFRDGLFWDSHASLYKTLHVAAAGMWRWHAFHAHPDPNPNARGLQKLSRDVMRFIISCMLPSFYPPALDERLERYLTSYRRHMPHVRAIQAPQTPSRA